LHQVGDLFELNVKLWCQKVKQAECPPQLLHTVVTFMSAVYPDLYSSFFLCSPRRLTNIASRFDISVTNGAQAKAQKFTR
jgi:hypothetical protein